MGHKTHLVALTANLHNRVLLFFLDLFQIGERNPAFPLPAAAGTLSGFIITV